MLDSIYVGMSGLISFSKGLSNISNNVANLNTPGYKRTQLEFLDLYYRYTYSGSPDQQSSPYSQGGGVQAGASLMNFSDGEFRQTGNDLDLAVTGNGFFILRKDGQTLYTRAGQFEINDAGYLVSKDDGARVAGYSNGGLADISVAGKRSNAAKPTQNVSFTNALSTSSSTFSVSNISVFDSLGVEHKLTLNLTNDSASTPGRWTLAVVDGSTTVTTGEVRYSGGGSPLAGYDSVSFAYSPGGGATTNTVKFDFTGTNYFSSSSSTLSVGTKDGYGAGYLTKTTVDADGNVVLNYSNGQKVNDARLALSWFSNLSALEAKGSNRYVLNGDSDQVVGNPNQNGLGAIKSGGIEMSNVDLAQEFSELIVVQRGYQASSQVISAANEMIQQLGEIRGRR